MIKGAQQLSIRIDRRFTSLLAPSTKQEGEEFIDYAAGERTGDGRAEVWEDFCKAARTCELTGQTCRLSPTFKAAAARALQAFWQRTAPEELPRYRDEPEPSHD